VLDKIKELYEELCAEMEKQDEIRGDARSHHVLSTRRMRQTCPIVREILLEEFPDDWSALTPNQVEVIRDVIFHRIQDNTNCKFREALDNALEEQWDLVNKLRRITRALAYILEEHASAVTLPETVSISSEEVDAMILEEEYGKA